MSHSCRVTTWRTSNPHETAILSSLWPLWGGYYSRYSVNCTARHTQIRSYSLCVYICMCVHAKITKLCLFLWDPADYSPPDSPIHRNLREYWNVVSYALLQEIFLTQISNHVSYAFCIGRWVLHH